MQNIRALVRSHYREAITIAEMLGGLNADAGSLSSPAYSLEGDYPALAAHFACVVGQLLIASNTEAVCLKRGENPVIQRFIIEQLGANETGTSLRKAALGYLHAELHGYRYLSFESAEDAFAFVCEFRSLCAAREALDDADLSGTVEAIGETFTQAAAMLDEHSRHRLQRSTRALLAGYCMYPWSPARAGTLLQTHRVLFRSAGFFEEGSMGFGVSGLEAVLSESRADADVRGTVRAVLDNLQSALSDGIDIFDFIGDDPGSLPWPLREVTHGGRVMLIPSKGSGGCAPVLLAVANSTKRHRKLSPKAVMTKVQQSIIQCGGTLKAVIFLADAATHGSEVEDHIPIIQDFISARNFDVFIPVMPLGRRLTVLDWS